MLLRSVLPPPFHLDLFSFPVPHILIFDLGVCQLQFHQGFSKPAGSCVHSFPDRKREKPSPISIQRAQGRNQQLTGGLHATKHKRKYSLSESQQQQLRIIYGNLHQLHGDSSRELRKIGGSIPATKIVASRRDPEGLGRPNDLHPAHRAETEAFLLKPGLPQSRPDTKHILNQPTDRSPDLISSLSSTPPSDLRSRRCATFVTRCRGSLACTKYLGFSLRVVGCTGVSDWRQSAPIGGGHGPIRT